MEWRVALVLLPGFSAVVVDSDLKPGEEAMGYVQFEWKGGFQNPTPVRFTGIALPRVTAPRQATMSPDISSRWHPTETAQKSH